MSIVTYDGTKSSSAISFVVIAVVLDPAGVWASTRRVRVRAVHPIPRPGVDVELAVDDDRVPVVHGDGLGEADVVIDLEHLAGGGLDLESLVVAGRHRVAHHGRVEGDLRAARVALDVLVQPLVVGGLEEKARAARPLRSGDQ